MKSIILFPFIVTTVFNIATCDYNKNPVIKTALGEIEGVWKTTTNGRKIQAFMGIPYAKPPVGPLRFQNPVPFGSWSSILDGTKDATVCPQFGTFVGKPLQVIGKDDCLYLNVYTPDAAENTKYPVMVYLHGGAYQTGGCFSTFYGPDHLLDKDVVLVCPNYRIGVLGFGSTEDEVFPGNLGLKDQNLALKWVNENIASYGGNPDSVTLFGESAGGASTHFHMLSPHSKGLFHRAALMSGTAYNPWAISGPGRIANYTKKLGQKLRCSVTTSKILMECLSKVPANSLVLTTASFMVWEGLDPLVVFSPVLEPESENSFITKDSYLSHPTVPMMVGATTDEGSFKAAFYFASPLSKLESILSKLDKKFEKIGPVAFQIEDKFENPVEFTKQLKQHFFSDKAISKDTLPDLINMFSETFFYEGIKIAVQRENCSSFIYLFGVEGRNSLAKTISRGKFKYGVAHGDELQYLFPAKLMVGGGLNEEEKRISHQLVEYFVNFAIYGNPTPYKKPVEWIPATRNNFNYLLINTSESTVHNHFKAENEEFWRNIGRLRKVLPQLE